MSLENQAVYSAVINQVPVTNTVSSPLLIGDSIHIFNQQVHKALITQDGTALGNLVQRQLAAGVQALAVNLGPGKAMGRLTPWVVNTIREITDTQLFFSANILAQKQILQAHGQYITINAVTANRDDLDRALDIAQEYGSSLVVLLVQAGKMTAGIEDRLQLASEVLDQAMLKNFPLSRLYLDPVLSSRPDPVAWHVSRGLPDVGSVVETIALIKQLDGRVKTIVALANGSEGMAREKRSGFHGQILALFTEAGIDAVLLNCLDSKMMRNSEGRSLSRGVDSGMGQKRCSAA